MTLRKFIHDLSAVTALLAVPSAVLVPAPAQAQFGGIVYDPSNYAQNVLTAARSLEQVNNQIRMLQNDAQQLINEAKNLEGLPLSVLQPIQQQFARTRQLIDQAQSMAFDVQQIQTRFDQQYRDIDLSASNQALVQGARQRWQTSVAAFEDALKIQAGAVGNIAGARTSIDQLVDASQSASGALQAAQAGNQLLALQSQQIADLIATVATMGRAQSLDAANAEAAKAQAREQLRRFLAPGQGYVPVGAQLYHN